MRPSTMRGGARIAGTRTQHQTLIKAMQMALWHVSPASCFWHHAPPHAQEAESMQALLSTD